jgi:hypothetical protein
MLSPVLAEEPVLTATTCEPPLAALSRPVSVEPFSPVLFELKNPERISSSITRFIAAAPTWA